jgi:hypothetical protein
MKLVLCNQFNSSRLHIGRSLLLVPLNLLSTSEVQGRCRPLHASSLLQLSSQQHAYSLVAKCYSAKRKLVCSGMLNLSLQASLFKHVGNFRILKHFFTTDILIPSTAPTHFKQFAPNNLVKSQMSIDRRSWQLAAGSCKTDSGKS